jgi:predicted RNA binding protein YcfA (HicA-like mRNA interferase family)
VSQLPIIKAEKLVNALQKAGFEPIRQRGSHLRLKHSDGRVVTVPIHQGQDVGKGLLRKILRDAELSVDQLIDLLN